MPVFSAVDNPSFNGGGATWHAPWLVAVVFRFIADVIAIAILPADTTQHHTPVTRAQ
jgi:hypothetical protein